MRGDATNLLVQGSTDELVTIQPALEIGGEVGLSNGARVRGWVRAGLTSLLSGENVGLTARFGSAPAEVASMTFTRALDETSTDLAVGLDVLGAKGLTLRLMYSQADSDNARTQTGSVKVSAAF
jgi:hypothetical protein